MKRKRPLLIKKEEGYLLTWEEDPSSSVILKGEFGPAEDSPKAPLTSPTLLLNATFFSEEELLALALSEKGRFEENFFKTYEIDTRKEPVAIVSNNPTKLQKFLETYGGLFKARAFCLRKNPDFPLIEDLTIAYEAGAYLFSYLFWAPVDEEKCLSCGLCGRSCPKEAISPGPRIDVSRCDFCRTCEKVCPSGAIDLFRYETREESFSRVVFLEEVPEGISRKKGRLFGPEELEEFFGSLGRFEISEVVRFQDGRCQFVPRFGSGCLLCLQSCPKEALEITEKGLKIDHFLCKECGSCVARCPTGALEFAPFDDRGFFSYLAGLPSLEGRVVVIGTEEELARFFWHPSYPEEGDFFFLAHGAPASLGPEKLLSLLAKGARNIVFLSEAPEDYEFTNEILERLFRVRPIAKLQREEFKEKFSRLSPVKISLKALPAFKGRRAYFRDLLYQFWLLAEKPAFALPARDFGWLEIAPSSCTLCLACLNECHTEALKADPQRLALTFEPALCVGCGICEEICPEKALRLEKTLRLDENFFEKLTLQQDEPVFCRRCGKYFGTRKSQEKVRNTLADLGRFNNMLSLLDYCEDCRVKEIFEEEE